MDRHKVIQVLGNYSCSIICRLKFNVQSNSALIYIDAL